MPTIALTGVRMMLIALKMMLTKVKTRPMMRKACVVRAIPGCILVVVGSIWFFFTVVCSIWLHFGCYCFYLVIFWLCLPGWR